MKVIGDITEIREMLSKARAQGKSVGLVPTMGYFHEGHLSLMRTAREQNDLVVVSIFVNPIQFGPKEDLSKYPRDLQRDSAMAQECGVDVILHPSPEEMYPKGYATYVGVEKITEVLCGKSRPGHFLGVATVVLKLLNIVQPDRAYFGMKDYQQFLVIRKMVTDLNLGVEIVPMPIVREADGLAMSSRNAYLSDDERKAALVLSKALHHAKYVVRQGITSPVEIGFHVWEFIRKEPLAEIEYVQVVEPETLDSVENIKSEALLAIAVKIGKTRLIDNTMLRR